MKVCSTNAVDYWKSPLYRAKVIILHGPGLPYVTLYRRKYTGKVISLQYEQVYDTVKNTGLGRALVGDCKNMCHVCWGEKIKRLLKNEGIDECNLPVVGPIQFDMMRDQFRGYYLSKQEIAQIYNLEADKEWILFISDFAYLSVNCDVNRVKSEHGKRGMFVYEYMNKAYAHIIEFIKKFVSEHPDIIYIYRPHPSESYIEELSNLEKIYPNFKYIKDRNIKQWILVSDKINTWNSSSINEAYVAKKPCMIVNLPMDSVSKEMFESFHVPTIDYNRVVSSYEEFERWNSEQQIFNQETYPIEMNKFNEFYGGFEEELPTYIKLCDYFEKVLNDDRYIHEYRALDYKNSVLSYWRDDVLGTLRSEIQLHLFPIINRIFPSKCKLDYRLEWHSKKNLSEYQIKIKELVDNYNR